MVSALDGDGSKIHYTRQYEFGLFSVYFVDYHISAFASSSLIFGLFNLPIFGPFYCIFGLIISLIFGQKNRPTFSKLCVVLLYQMLSFSLESFKIIM